MYSTGTGSVDSFNLISVSKVNTCIENVLHQELTQQPRDETLGIRVGKIEPSKRQGRALSYSDKDMNIV
jgi:hypothetical protein